MPQQPRFLLGHGERLSGPAIRATGGGPPSFPYSFEEALERLRPQVQTVAEDVSELPRLACPGDQAIGVVTMHPQFLAKSYFPQALLSSFNLRSVGSRPANVTPEKVSRRARVDSVFQDIVSFNEEPAETVELFVAGRRSDIQHWARSLSEINPGETAATDLRRIETIRPLSTTDRLRVPISRRGVPQLYEVVLHTGGWRSLQFLVDAFEEYALAMEAQPIVDRAIQAGGLCYLPMYVAPRDLARLAQFSFLRVVRPVPELRVVHPIERSFGSPSNVESPLPSDESVDPDLVAAVFDGGLADSSVIDNWTQSVPIPGVGPSVAEYVRHGTRVSSALLFGSLIPGSPAARPYGKIHNFRVLDRDSGRADVELYDVLKRIDTVLATGKYEFVNFSLGPTGPIEDDEVHTWTAVIDQHLAAGNVLATVAVGNDGELDHASGNARIQVPSDAVNALSVGAADSTRDGWSRAPYSSIGPGRRPGVVKPDILHFGGCPREPFYVYDGTSAYPAPTGGTSFASPAALRAAMGVRAHFGPEVGVLGLKALLIHTSEPHTSGFAHVGWGRCGGDLADMVVCEDGAVRVLYQDILGPSSLTRLPIPLPDEQMAGNTTITATICYTTQTDPQDPSTYTRSGLSVIFRPHSSRFDKNGKGIVPKRGEFFKKADYETEQEQRSTGHKWETVLHHSRTLRASSLYQPAFDVHYVPRQAGGVAYSPEPIKYAMVVTVQNSRTADLYDRVVRDYATILEPLQPVVEVPIQIA